MRTTFDIPTPLFRRVKEAAARQGVTMRALVVRALEAHVVTPAPAKPYKFDWKGVDLGPVDDAELWRILKDRDRRWLKRFWKEVAKSDRR